MINFRGGHTQKCYILKSVYNMFFKTIVLILLIFTLTKSDEDVCKTNNPLIILKKQLMCNYNKNELPRKSSVLIGMQMILKYLEFVSISIMIVIKAAPCIFTFLLCVDLKIFQSCKI